MVSWSINICENVFLLVRNSKGGGGNLSFSEKDNHNRPKILDKIQNPNFFSDEIMIDFLF